MPSIRVDVCCVSVTALVIAGVLGVSPAQAQASRTNVIEELVVTAERRTEDLQSVPISATVLDAQAMRNKSVTGLTAIQFAAPAIFIADYSSANTFNIRGVGQSKVDVDLPSGVVIYRDGVPTLTGYFQNAPYYDMAGVEVLRGPQGTFGGKSAAAGALFIRTRDPQLGDKVTGDWSAGVGNYNFYEVTGVANLPLSDTLAVRLALHYEQRGSLFESITSNPLPGALDTGGPFTGDDKRQLGSIRIGVLWQPNDQFTAIAKLDYDNLDLGSHAASGFGLDGREEDVANPIITGSHEYNDVGPRASLNLRYKLENGVTLSSLTGYSTVDSTANWDINGADPRPSGFFTHGRFKNVSQEVNLLSPEDQRLRWVAGAFYQFFRSRFLDYPDRFGFLSFSLPGLTVPLIETPWLKEENGYALFGQVEYDLTDRLELQVGGRWGYYEFDQFTEWTLPAFGGIPFQQPVGGVRQHFSEKSVDWKVSLNYQASDAHFFYALVSRGHSPGSINLFPNPTTPVTGRHSDYDEMKVINYEGGWKGEFQGGRLRTQLAAYYQTFEDYQAYFALAPSQIEDVVLNLTEARNALTTSKIWGVEFGAQAVLGDWSFDLGLAYTRSKLGSFGVIIDPFAVFYGGPGEIDLSGAETPFAPRVTANAGVSYTFHLADDLTATPRVDIAYRTKAYADLFQNPSTLLDERTLVNAQVRFEKGPWWASVWVTNLTDERYAGAKQNVTGAPPDAPEPGATLVPHIDGIVYMANPRLFGVRVGRSF